MSDIVPIVSGCLDGQSPAQQQQQADTIMAAVELTRSQVPGMRALDVGRNIVEAADAWDLGAVMVFDSREALEAYQHHLAHLALRTLVAPLRQARRQRDFERASRSLGNVAPRSE